eukprot:1151204-Pelagomonas_calceolata.AAC.4
MHLTTCTLGTKVVQWPLCVHIPCICSLTIPTIFFANPSATALQQCKEEPYISCVNPAVDAPSGP